MYEVVTLLNLQLCEFRIIIEGLHMIGLRLRTIEQLVQIFCMTGPTRKLGSSKYKYNSLFSYHTDCVKKYQNLNEVVPNYVIYYSQSSRNIMNCIIISCPYRSILSIFPKDSLSQYFLKCNVLIVRLY